MSTVSLKNIYKIYDNSVTAVSDFNLEIADKEFIVLVGPSGCGKSTTLRMVAGLEEISKGELYIDGKLVNDVEPKDRDIAMVFQSYALYPHMTVRENMEFPLKLKKVPKEEIQQRVDQAAEILGITQYLDRKPKALSGGQRQRVAIGRAIVREPKVLLMDEPLSNLDAKLRVEMRNAIKRIQQQVGITTIYVTHDQEEALAVSDRIAVMNGGVIQQIDTPKNVYQRPANVFVSTFIGLSNIMDGRIRMENGRTLVQMGDYTVPMDNLRSDCRDGQAVKVSVRPEEFIIDRDGDEGIPAVVRNSVFLGITTHYFVEAEDGREMEVIQNSDIWDIIPDHTPIRLGVQPRKINVFTEDGSESLIVRRDHS